MDVQLHRIEWLVPQKIAYSDKMCNSDFQKRKELFLEFIYYVFDSLLIPLIRSNFYVTESNSHQNRLFFFRHDVWRQLTEPSLATIKISMFEEIKTNQARKLLDSRVLGFSQLRLLPKNSGVRPIMNLRRRVAKVQNGKSVLGRGINAVLSPIFNMLDYEKLKQPNRIGSALLSVGEMYPKLKAFRQRLQSVNAFPVKLYFIKGDVQSCFDTIPQQKLLKLVKDIAAEDEYKITRHAEIKYSRAQAYKTGADARMRPSRRFISLARARTDFQTFEQRTRHKLATGKQNTVFVDSVIHVVQKKDTLLELLEDHIERNIVKIGKKFFRQKAGIPQGSVLSSLLCNFFYAALEEESLGFLDANESLLLRLIDDFLLITSNREHAEKFSQIMHRGVETYGVRFHPSKSLANFQVYVDGSQIPQSTGKGGFPYCGNMVDTKTLEITKDRNRRKNTSKSMSNRDSSSIVIDRT